MDWEETCEYKYSCRRCKAKVKITTTAPLKKVPDVCPKCNQFLMLEFDAKKVTIKDITFEEKEITIYLEEDRHDTR
jgi:uncharacterized UBP type Zn finger protein